MDDPTTSGVTEGFGLMFFKARFYDPQLGRFSSPDTIIPEESQGTQAWDRYAFVNNNPARYNDPSGHCIGPLMEFCGRVWVATAFLAIRGIANGGRLEAPDFEDAADLAAPAVADGSKESITATGSIMATVLASATLISTDDGEIQLYKETGVGGTTPQLTVTATHGAVFGLETAANYQGGATQATGSLSVFGVLGVAGEAYKGDTPVPGDQPSVYGVDWGVSIGPGLPLSLGAAQVEATMVEGMSLKLEGAALLGCRLLSMCGAQ